MMNMAGMGIADDLMTFAPGSGAARLQLNYRGNEEKRHARYVCATAGCCHGYRLPSPVSCPQAKAADPAAGKSAFSSACSICHSVQPDKNMIGPSLFGVVGRKTGSVPGFHYSPANQSANLTWDAATLDKYLQSPRTAIPGTIMTYGGHEGRRQACRPDRVSGNAQISRQPRVIFLPHYSQLEVDPNRRTAITVSELESHAIGGVVACEAGRNF